MELETGRTKGKATHITCESMDSLNGVLTEGDRYASKDKLVCKFEGEQMRDRKYLDRLVVDGDVKYEEDLTHGEGRQQKVKISSRRQPLKVSNAKNLPSTLVVTTDSAEEQENRQQGQMPLPDNKKESYKGAMSKGKTVTKVACQTDHQADPLKDPLSSMNSSCVISNSDGEIESVDKVKKKEVVGDVEIIKNNRQRDLRITPRTSIIDTDAEQLEEGVKLKLHDRKHRRSNQ